MSKNTLLEVDFDNLAWSPVSSTITNKLSNCIKPLEMARGKKDVYLKCAWDYSDEKKLQELHLFQDVFIELDQTNKVGGIKDAFIPNIPDAASKAIEEPTEDENTDNKIDKMSDDDFYNELDKSLEDVDLGEDDLNDDDVESIKNEIDAAFDEEDKKNKEALAKENEDYIEEKVSEGQKKDSPNKFYVVNTEAKTIDSGWDDEKAADNRLSAIKGTKGNKDSDNYNVIKYDRKLLSLVGDPMTVKWQPFNIQPFYVVNIKRREIDSSYTNEEEATARISDIKSLINDIVELFDDKNDADLSIDDFKVLNGEETFKLIGLSASFKDLFVNMDDIKDNIIRALKKKGIEINMDKAFMEAISTQNSQSLNPFYLIFNFTEDYNPDSDEGRRKTKQNILKEYSEIEIKLKELISSTGDQVVTSKELLKASESLDTLLPYQLTIQMLNNTADYFYKNLKFAETAKNFHQQEIDRVDKNTYKIGEEEVDDNPSAKIDSDYVENIVQQDGQDRANALSMLAEYLESLHNNELKDGDESEINTNSKLENDIEGLIKTAYAKYPRTISKCLTIFKENIIPLLHDKSEGSLVYKELITGIKEDVERMNNNPSGENKMFNTALTNASFDRDKPDSGFNGLPWKYDQELKQAQANYTALYNEHRNDFIGKTASQKAKLMKDLFTQKYGESLQDIIKRRKKEINGYM